MTTTGTPVMRPVDTPQLLTMQEVADILRVHYSTVHRMINRGELPSVRVGGVRRVSQSDLEQWIAERTERGR